MKRSILLGVIFAGAAYAGAQTAPPTKDSDLTGLTTPSVLAKGKSQAGLQFNAFGGSDKLVRTGVSLGFGIADGWEGILEGSFATFGSFDLASGSQIRFGGSAGDAILKYKISGMDASFQAGVAYSNTPAQEQRTAGILGFSAGWTPTSSVRLYFNPKWVALDSNSLVGLSVGGVVDISSGISIFGDWTPLVAGDNTLSTVDGSRERVQLYAVGFRFANLFSGVSLDLAYTNMTGQTAGFSLTPSLGNTGGLYVGLTYGF